jgi:hypothetical protein
VWPGEGFWGERQITTGQLQLAGSAGEVSLDFGDLWRQVEDDVTRD